MNSSWEKRLQRLIRQLTTAAANCALYDEEHPQVLRLCREALDDLQSLLQDTPPAVFKLIDHRLIYNDRPVPGNLAVERFISALLARGISYIEVTPGISGEELLQMVRTLSKGPAAQASVRNSEHVCYSHVEVRLQSAEDAAPTAQTMVDFAEIADRDRDKFLEIYDLVRRNKPLNVVGISEIVDDFIDVFSAQGDVMLALAPLRSMDEYVYVHSTNICLLNLAQARLLGVRPPLLQDIGIAAMLHDVGKMFIPPEILNKQGKLDDAEWAIMQRHPQLGAEYLLNSPGVPRLAVVAAYEHHMGYDGSGYPRRPADWRLNPCSYMTSISDVYDALRTRRSYRDSLTPQQISGIMLDSAGASLHPDLTRSFLQAIAEH